LISLEPLEPTALKP